MKNYRRTIIFTSIVVVVIGLSAGAAVLFNHYNAAKQDDAAKQAVTTPPPAEQAADDAAEQAFKGDAKGGVASLDKAIQGTSDTHEQFIYYSQKATILQDEKDFAGALTAATKAFNLEKTSDSAAFVGQVASDKGDTAMALDYYKKAVQLIDDGDPLAKTDREYYNGVVADLEAKK